MPDKVDNQQTQADAQSAVASVDNAALQTRAASRANDVRGSSYEEGSQQLSPQGDDEGGGGGISGALSRLDEWLSAEIAELVRENLSAEDVAKYANDGVSDGVEAIFKELGKDRGKSEVEALKKFSEQLAAALSEGSDAYLKSEKGQKLVDGLVKWPEEHPRTVVLIALLAVAGAVAANVDLPKLKQKFKLGGGFTAGLEAELGKVRAIALESVTASINYQRGKLSAGVSATHKEGEDPSGSVSLGYGDKEDFIKTVGTLKSDGQLDVTVTSQLVHDAWTLAAEAKGDASALQNAKATVSYAHDKNHTTTAGVHYKKDEGFALSLGDTFTEGMWKTNVGTEYSFDSEELAGTTGLRYGTDARHIGLGLASTGDKTSGSVQAKLTRDDVALELGLTAEHLRSTDELNTTVNFGTRYQVDDQQHLSGNVEFGLGGAGLRSLALGYGYENAETFEKYLLEYKRSYADDLPDDTFMIHAQRRLTNRLSLGVRNTTTLRDGGFAGNNLNVLAGYRSTIGGEDVTWLGGVEQEWGADDRAGATSIKAGVQVRGVPLTIKYTPETKTTMFQVELFRF